MAKRSLNLTTQTPTATADATNLADATYHGVIQGGSSTQRITIVEVACLGQGTSTGINLNLLSRDSTVGVTASLGSGLNDAALSAATAALAAPPVVGNTFSTKPQRSSSLHLLNISINAFGGVFRWVASPGEEIDVVGQSANTGEVSLSAFSGSTPGPQGSHIIYEPQ